MKVNLKKIGIEAEGDIEGLTKKILDNRENEWKDKEVRNQLLTPFCSCGISGQVFLHNECTSFHTGSDRSSAGSAIHPALRDKARGIC